MKLCIQNKQTSLIFLYYYIGEQSTKTNKRDVSYLSSAVTIPIPFDGMESLSHMTYKDTKLF